MPEKLVTDKGGEPVTDYTPDTEEVRHRYGRDTADHVGMVEVKAHAEFDLWLAGVIRHAKHDAWEQGAEAGFHYAACDPSDWPVNPYTDE